MKVLSLFLVLFCTSIVSAESKSVVELIENQNPSINYMKRWPQWIAFQSETRLSIHKGQISFDNLTTRFYNVSQNMVYKQVSGYVRPTKRVQTLFYNTFRSGGMRHPHHGEPTGQEEPWSLHPELDLDQVKYDLVDIPQLMKNVKSFNNGSNRKSVGGIILTTPVRIGLRDSGVLPRYMIIDQAPGYEKLKSLPETTPLYFVTGFRFRINPPKGFRHAKPAFAIIDASTGEVLVDGTLRVLPPPPISPPGRGPRVPPGAVSSGGAS